VSDRELVDCSTRGGTRPVSLSEPHPCEDEGPRQDRHSMPLDVISTLRTTEPGSVDQQTNRDLPVPDSHTQRQPGPVPLGADPTSHAQITELPSCIPPGTGCTGRDNRGPCVLGVCSSVPIPTVSTRHYADSVMLRNDAGRVRMARRGISWHRVTLFLQIR
jgi:hypothetical protein